MTTRPGRPHLPTSPFKPQPEAPIEEFEVGERVSHDTYGLGRVTGTDATAVTVDFDGRKIRITSPFRKMRKL